MVTSKVYPLADALQLEIDIFSNGGNDFELKGSRNWVIPIIKTDFKFKTKIEASYVDEFQAAALVSVSKNFWIYAHFSNEVEVDGVITLYYLDTKGISAKTLKDEVDAIDVDNALVFLRPLCKAKFLKGTNEITWTKLPLKVDAKA